jgi:hypothetical protein
MRDDWERFVWGTDPLDAKADLDADGFVDAYEVFTASTDPRNADSDLDGLHDAAEATHQADAHVRDTDGDYLADGQEQALSLDPAAMDSNGDRLPDGAEVALGLVSATRADTQDTDGDGLPDGREVPGPIMSQTDHELLVLQVAGGYLANPDSRDTDRDGLDEGAPLSDLAAASRPSPDRNFAAFALPFEAIDLDTDRDGAADALDRDADGDWLVDGTGTETLALADDVDHDGIPNARDADSFDNDRLSDPMESMLFEIAQARGDSDYDDDAILDGNEYYHWFFNAQAVKTNPRVADTDLDHLADAVESGVTAVQQPMPPASQGVGGTLGDPKLDVDATANSNPLLRNSDMDGIPDGIEDHDRNGARAPVETDPLANDTDQDGMSDGAENSKVDLAIHEHIGGPVYERDRDNANGLSADTDGDRVPDGMEMGIAAGYMGDPEDADSDRDGLEDGEEDPNFNGVVDAGETDPMNCDSDNDRVFDGSEAPDARLDPAHGGADVDVAIGEGMSRITMAPADAGQPRLDGQTSFGVSNTLPGANPQEGDGPSAVPAIGGYYVIATDFVWSGQAPGYTTPDPECKPILQGGWTIQSEGIAPCGELAAGTHAYAAAFTTPVATLPGVYRGTLFFVASSGNCAEAVLACASADQAVPTMTPFAELELEVVVPARYDLDVWNDDGAPGWGVAGNQMRLTGLPEHAGTLTGTFQVANPNDHADPMSLNCTARSDNNWDADIQGNARIEKVGFRFVSQPVPGVAELDPGSALSFAPASLTDFDLGTMSQVVVQLDTRELGTCGAAGGIAGTVEAYRDLNKDGRWQSGEPVLDAFAIHIDLVSPDLDIADNQGSLVGNKLERRVDLSRALENWTFRGSATCDVPTNGLLDAFDGPGCEGWTGLYLFDPKTKVETAVAVAAAPCSEPAAPASSFQVYKYDPVTQTYDLSRFFKVNVWSCQDAQAACGSTDEFTLKVDPSVLTANMPDGTYRPYWGMDAGSSFQNGYVVLSTRGTLTRSARPSTGYPVVYAGGDVNSSTWGYFDRFEVSLQLVNPPCAPSFADNTIRLPEVNPGLSSTVDAVLQGCATKPLNDLAVTVSPLLRVGGGDQIVDASATLDAQAIPVGGSTLVHVTVNGAEHRDGTYRGTLTLTTSEPGQGVTLDVEAVVLPPCAPAAAGMIEIPDLGPGSSGQGSVTVTGCTQPLTGLSVSVGELVGPGGRDRISDAVASVDATNLPVGATTTARVTVNAAAHLAGTYTGTATVNAANGRHSAFEVRVTIGAESVFEIVGTPTLALVDEESRKIFIRNTGNTDLTLTAVVPEELPFVTIAPDPLTLAWQQEAEVTVTAAPDPGRPAGNYAGEIRFTAPAASDKPVATVATVSARPMTNTPKLTLTVERGNTAKLSLVTNNTGNVNLKSASLQFGDFVPARAGARTIPGPAGTIELGAIPMGGSKTTEIAVHVDAGIFCGQYTAMAHITGVPEFQTGTSEQNAEVALGVTGCERRPMAFSRNPVRYAQTRTVDIAFASGGVVTAKVYNMSGVLVKELANRISVSGGQLTWDFRNGKGDLVASGMYLVVAQIDGKEFREKLLFVK